MGHLVLLTFSLLVLSASARRDETHLIEQLKTQLELLQTASADTRIFPKQLNDTLRQLQIPLFFGRPDPGDIDFVPNDEVNLEAQNVCDLCYVTAGFLIAERRLGVSVDVIAVEAETVCTLLKIENAAVCKGVIALNLPIFVYLVDSDANLQSRRICDVILQNSGCNSTTFDWSVDIPEGVTVQRKEPSDPEATFNIVQITDPHYDPLYTAGKTKRCDEPLCCQSDQADGSAADGTACGYWTEYQSADSSEALVDETIRKAAEFDVDYVYFTGDVVSHRVWSTSVEDNSKNLIAFFRKLKAAFPGKPIYPILGNHEPSPLNEYTIGDDVTDEILSTEWLYRLIISEFEEWLPEAAQQDILQGGYYSVSPRKGFRIVALNNNVAYTMNWWLIRNDTDPFGQLAWLARTLKAAEDNDEVVHILAHIPSGKSDLLQVWSREYHRIVLRFANTIGAQFNGHTHKDQLVVYYSAANVTEAVSVAINGASVMADKSNPSFKIVNIDQKSFDVIDTQEWTFNLTAANSAGASSLPAWYQLYSFRDSYGVSSLTPTQLGELLPRMATQHELLEQYNIFRYRNSDIALRAGCDDSCKKNALCEMATSQVADSTQCDILREIFDKN